MLENYRQDIFLKFHNPRQRESIVEDYTTKFDHLLMKHDIAKPEEHTIARYLAVLQI